VTPPPGNPPPVLPPQPPPGSKQVVFVIGDANNENNADLDLDNFMSDLGFLVTPVDENDNSRDFRDYGLVVISSSANANAVRDDWDTSQPVLVLDDQMMVELQMVSDRNQDSGTINAREIDIRDETHPMAAGLQGRVLITDQNQQLTFGTPDRGADIVATIRGQQRLAVMFAYPAGVDLARSNINRNSGIRTAKNRRCGFFLRNNTDFRNLRKDGEDLLEAAINYCYAGDQGVR
jgi:hypothetical protein